MADRAGDRQNRLRSTDDEESGRLATINPGTMGGPAGHSRLYRDNAKTATPLYAAERAQLSISPGWNSDAGRNTVRLVPSDPTRPRPDEYGCPLGPRFSKTDSHGGQ